MKPQTGTDRVTVRAPAKINLCLHVGERREDGYHALESLVAFAHFGDDLTFTRAERLSLSVNGPFAGALADGEDNLVLKAARSLAHATGSGLGADIALTKNIPVASGVGGGSADAAATLRGLSCLWDLAIPREELQRIAASIGSDVPVCLESATAWMEGRGEQVRLLPQLPEISIILVNPNVPVSTAEVFRRLERRSGTGRPVPSALFSDVADLVRYLESTTNDLERPAIAIAPVIGVVMEALQQLPGALFARMSGSGATCFALMQDAESARNAVQALHETHADWWAVETSLASGEIGSAKFV